MSSSFMSNNFVFDKYVEFLKAHPLPNTISIVSSFVFPIEDIIIPIFVGLLVDALKKGAPWRKYLVAIVGVMVVMQVIDLAVDALDAWLIPSLQNHVRRSMFYDMLKSRDEAFTEFNTGEAVSQLVKVPLVTVKILEVFKHMVLPHILSILCISAYIGTKDWVVGLSMFVALVFIFSCFYASPGACENVVQTMTQTSTMIDEEIDDVLRNASTVFASNQIEQEMARLKILEDKLVETSFPLFKCSSKQRVVIALAIVTLLLLIGWRCNDRINKGVMTAGVVVTIFTFSLSIINNFAWMSHRVKNVISEFGVIKSYMQQHRVKASSNACTIPPLVKGLVLKDISFSLPGRKDPILKDVNLHVATGERVAIVGKIGAGKSTLLKIIVRLITPTSGQVILDGVPYDCMSASAVRKKVAYVCQHPLFFNRSILENISYGLDADKVKIIKILERMGLSDVLGDLDMNVGKGGSKLSGGQRQVVACIRVMLQNPDIIVLDEITASLDSGMKQRLLKMLDEMFRGKTVIIVTHDPILARFASRVVNISRDLIYNC